MNAESVRKRVFMARKVKKAIPPTAGVVVNGGMASLMEAFAAGSERMAKKLIHQSAEAIYAENSVIGGQEVTKEHVNEVYSLMCSLDPKDAVEVLFCTHVVVAHVIGMRKLSQACSDDKAIGLRMLKFAAESIDRLDKRRNGVKQTINVTYNNIGPSQQAIISGGDGNANQGS